MVFRLVGPFLPTPLEVWLLHVLGARNPPQQELVYELGTDGTFICGRIRKVKPPAPASEYKACKECDDQSGSWSNNDIRSVDDFIVRGRISFW
jgi:hypothetical protein